MSVGQREEDRLRTWELSWNGVHWHDMPGDDSDHQKLNFCLWKRGLKEYELNEAGELREVAPRFGAVGSMMVPRGHTDALEALRERVRGLIALGLTQSALAREAGICETQLNKVMARTRGMRPEKVSRLKAVVEQYEARREALRAAQEADRAARAARAARCATTLPGVDGRRAWAVPPGMMRFNDWLVQQAEARGIRVPAVRMALRRGVLAWPEGMVKVNARRWFVPVPSAERRAQGAGRGAQGEAQAGSLCHDGEGVAA